MGQSRFIWIEKASRLFKEGADLRERRITRGPQVDEWESRSMVVLQALDQKLYEKMVPDIESRLGSFITGKKDRIEALMDALDRASDPGPGEPLAKRR